MLHASLERVMKTREEIRTSLFSAVCDLMAFSISFPHLCIDNRHLKNSFRINLTKLLSKSLFMSL